MLLFSCNKTKRVFFFNQKVEARAFMMQYYLLVCLLIYFELVAGSETLRELPSDRCSCNDLIRIRPPPSPHKQTPQPPPEICKCSTWRPITHSVTPDNRIYDRLCGMCTKSSSSPLALGVLTGILLASLVAVIVGWIVTCFVLKMKMKVTVREKDPQASTNSTQQVLSHNMLVHDTSRPLQATFYSSLGPDYEALDNRRPQQRGIPIQGSHRETTTDRANHVNEQQTVDHTYQELEEARDKYRPVQLENKHRDMCTDNPASSYEVPVAIND